MEPGGSMPHSQGLSNISYPGPNQPNFPHWYLSLQGGVVYTHVETITNLDSVRIHHKYPANPLSIYSSPILKLYFFFFFFFFLFLYFFFNFPLGEEKKEND